MIKQLSIIIPAYNEADYLPRTLESIARQCFFGDLEVVVVDGQSEDNTIASAALYKARFDNFKVISAKRDIGHQRNVGAANSRYPFMLFLDADVFLPPGTLNRLAAKIKTAEPFVGSVTHVGDKMSVSDYATLVLIYLLLGISWLARVPVTNGDFILTTRETHNRIARGFVEDTILGEDTDYGIRAVRGGARYRFYPTVKIVASDRRIREVGRLRLVIIWSRSFIHVLRKGPILKGENVNYPYGHYTNSHGIVPAPNEKSS